MAYTAKSLRSQADKLAIKICEALGFNSEQFPTRKVEIVLEVGCPALVKIEFFPSMDDLDKIDVDELVFVSRVEEIKPCGS